MDIHFATYEREACILEALSILEALRLASISFHVRLTSPCKKRKSSFYIQAASKMYDSHMQTHYAFFLSYPNSYNA
jgi:hypothetical protein